MQAFLNKTCGFLKCARARYKGFVWFALFSLIATGTMAGEYQVRKDIEKTAETFLHKHLALTHTDQFDIHISTLDRRLKLSQCDTALEAFLPAGARLYGKTTVGVRCGGTKPWKIFVPAKLTLYENVLAVARPIVKGEVLGRDDLALVSKEIGPASQSYFRDAQQAIGYIAKRSIPAGRILTAHMVQAPRLVQAGQQVILLATTPQLEVRMKGKALSDGSEGDVIQVRNLRSRRVVEGVVTHTGVVRVNM